MKLSLEEICKLIIDEIHSVIPELDESSISMDQGFMEMGVESLQAVTIIGSLSQRLNVPLDMTALFDRPNLSSLSEYIYEILYNEINLQENKEFQDSPIKKEKIS
ncbi:MAG: acyl carrier protein, partial [Bdellovibrionales bacterium]|nr:acyl carrier protein [Bdellovibrionales bacterium]